MWFYSNYKNMCCFKKIYDNVLEYMNVQSDLYEKVSNTLGSHDISNASVLYKRFFEDYNLWSNRNALVCHKN